MHPGPHRRGPRHRRARGRRYVEGEGWEVEAPVSRFVEPAALLVLRGGRLHGYDLADQIGALVGVERVDYGNLYRLLRRLEAEEIVTSEWAEGEGDSRSKRVYELTPHGAGLLDAWIDALEVTQDRISEFLHIYREGSP